MRATADSVGSEEQAMAGHGLVDKRCEIGDESFTARDDPRIRLCSACHSEVDGDDDWAGFQEWIESRPGILESRPALQAILARPPKRRRDGQI